MSETNPEKLPRTPVEWWEVFNAHDTGRGTVEVTYGTLQEFEASVLAEQKVRVLSPAEVNKMLARNLDSTAHQMNPEKLQPSEEQRHAALRITESKLFSSELVDLIANTFAQREADLTAKKDGEIAQQKFDAEMVLMTLKCIGLEIRSDAPEDKIYGPRWANTRAEKLQKDLADLRSKLSAAEAESRRLLDACSRQNYEIEQTLAQAIGGYPWFKDDQENFPGATATDGVCVGDNVPESLAEEAAATISALRDEIKYLKTCGTIEMMCENPNVDAHVKEWEIRLRRK